ncbi:phytoene dehydrogenase-like protein [Larkinella arboricola]|uniref:Phytoene dehydrogenase-like protein n=1 Tax=Larkinella arboricola TaxID=643671 RepID=A0A327WSL3_LARAB|nr:NAD(P)/FAD-dependent oxidoreductase [Larkinella arboricola]RAJ95628.1 phytoene dehydrogenase-like protein [Larkinella arboricola]
MQSRPSVVIVGAGMAGLTCAVYLRQAGIEALLLEASDRVGGRIRTDVIDGFRLDRGFQILLTAYPETRRLLDYNALNLQCFRPGALIHNPGGPSSDQWMSLINPLREPSGLLQTLASDAATFSDKVRIIELIRKMGSFSTDEFFQQQATDTETFLEEFGFSDQIINLFFRPFFGGIFLEDALATSSNFFQFCFKNFYSGDAAIPAAGMEAIPQQLAARLNPAQIRLNTGVRHIQDSTLYLENGETLQADRVVLAVDAAAANRLLGAATPERSFNHTTNTYFTAPKPSKPHHSNPEKLLILNPNRQSAVHHLAILSDVAPSYAPDGQTLISVSTQGVDVVNEKALAERIRKELAGWFGPEVEQWHWLKTYHLPEALPTYLPDASHAPLKWSERLFQCGDQTAYPSLNAAMQTGRKVAELIGQHPETAG